MKKYTSPEMVVIVMSQQPELLAGSALSVGDEFDGTELLAPEIGGSDMPDILNPMSIIQNDMFK